MSAPSVSIFPASFAQRRLWFIQQLTPASVAYNMMVSLELPPATHAPLLQRALDRLCAHHETLRTSFSVDGGDAVQCIAGSARITLQVHELPSRATFASLVSASVAAPFGLDRAPLARALVAYMPDAPPLLALVVHHIIADGASLQILLSDLQTLLQGELSGRPVVLAQPPIEYADYAVWQRRTLTGSRLQVLAEYWRGRLHALPELELPCRRGGPATARGQVVMLRLAPPVCRGLRALAADASATLFAVLLAGFSVVLGRFCGQRDFGIGLPVSGRHRVELERVAGLFINSVVFRATLPARGSFAALVRQVAAALAEDLSRQEMPFEQVVDALRAPRSAHRNPLFQVMLQLQQRAPLQATAGPRFRAPDLLEPNGLTAQLDLSLMLFESGDGSIEGGIVYAADLFDRAWIEQLAAACGLLLEAAAREPEQPFDALPLLDEAARRAILALGQGPQRDWPAPALLHDVFTQQARARPDGPAIVGAEGALGFAALERRAQVLVARLQGLGVRPGDTIALCAPCTADAVAAMLATLQCGAAYLPMDAAAPVAYREGLLEDSSARVVWVPAGGRALGCGLPVVELEAHGQGSAPRPATRAMPPPAASSRTAYLIYTSGSTGQPKGVRIPHAAIVNHMRWMLEQFEIGPRDRVLQRTPLSFDASVWEVWAPLLSGATLVLPEAPGPFDPGRLARQIQAQAITVLQVVPSLLRALLPHCRAGELRSLRLLFCGGEVLPPDLLRAAQAATDATVVNLYGPSETTIDASFHVCPAAGEADDGHDVPIGRPIANVVLRVLDERRQPVPWGVPGELHIGGAAVGLGYQRRPSLSAERFIDDPFAPGGRLFCSGDMVRMACDGTLHYIGRHDEQVKLRGFRIELGEVEARLSAHPAVAEAVAVVLHAGDGDDRLVAFASLRAGREQTTHAELLAWLRTALPAHAVPSSVCLLHALPRTAHGKVDRAALREHRLTRGERPTPAAAPRSALERRICACFEKQLKIERVDIDDDFFQLGGHSLLVFSVCEELSRALGSALNIVDLFEFPTPRLLARAIERRQAPPAPPTVQQASAGAP